MSVIEYICLAIVLFLILALILTHINIVKNEIISYILNLEYTLKKDEDEE